MSRKRYSPEVKNTVIRLYEAGHRFKDLATQFSMTPSSLARTLRGRTQYALGKKDIRRKLTTAQEQECLLRYNFGTTCEELGRAYDCSEATVRATLSRHGVIMRKQGPQYQTERTRSLISAKSKQQWQNNREKLLIAIRKIGFKSTDKVIEVRLTQSARTYLTPLVIGRDKTCVRCGSVKRLHIHHIEDLDDRPDLAIDPANCETLCRSCHMKEEANRRWSRIKAEAS